MLSNEQRIQGYRLTLRLEIKNVIRNAILNESDPICRVTNETINETVHALPIIITHLKEVIKAMSRCHHWSCHFLDLVCG